ncbi:MAG: transporter substrate-binding domain-containing protein [Candidatus Ventricola sp.]
MKMISKLVSLLLALALCMMLVTGASAEEDLKTKWASLAGRHLTVGTSSVQTGWSMDDGTGKPEGMDVDVMNYICDYYGLDLEWYVAEYASLWGCVQNGIIDTIANLTTVNPDRLSLYWFTNTYAWESYSIAYLKTLGDVADGDMDFWNGKTICGEAGSNATMTLESIIESKKADGVDIKLLTLDAAAVTVPAVAMGQADGAFQCTSTVGYIVENQGYSDTMNIQNVQWKNMPIVYGFARKEENKDLILAINDLLEQMHADGTLAELSNKWFGMDVTALPEGEVNYVTTTGDSAWQSYEN